MNSNNTEICRVSQDELEHDLQAKEESYAEERSREIEQEERLKQRSHSAMIDNDTDLLMEVVCNEDDIAEKIRALCDIVLGEDDGLCPPECSFDVAKDATELVRAIEAAMPEYVKDKLWS